MSEDIKKGEGAGNQTPQITPEEFNKMKEQVDNLNKGISTYRSEIKTKDEELAKLRSEFDEFKSTVEIEDEGKDASLNPEDEKKLEAWARGKGFVSQAELAAERQKIQIESMKSIESQAVSEFLEKYPEYDNDEAWTKVLSEFQLYRQPTSIDQYRKLLAKIHNNLAGGTNKAREEGRITAKIENDKKGRLSLGGGSQGSANENEAEIEQLHKRYPNLSRDQILERISEVRSLYSSKK